MIELLISFIFLLFLEIILGIDNIIFISIITEKLPKHLQRKVRIIGIGISLVFRLILLSFIGYLLRLSEPLFFISDLDFSIKDLIMLIGGGFLIVKATSSIHEELEVAKSDNKAKPKGALGAIVQIIIIDFVFSIDSLIMAIGLTNHLLVISAAVICSVIFMIFFAEVISRFVSKYPTFKMLALAFIMIIGIFLILEGFSVHVNKGYIYFAMAFSLIVEVLNNVIRSRKSKALAISKKNEK